MSYYPHYSTWLIKSRFARKLRRVLKIAALGKQLLKCFGVNTFAVVLDQSTETIKWACLTRKDTLKITKRREQKTIIENPPCDNYRS